MFRLITKIGIVGIDLSHLPIDGRKNQVTCEAEVSMEEENDKCYLLSQENCFRHLQRQLFHLAMSGTRLSALQVPAVEDRIPITLQIPIAMTGNQTFEVEVLRHQRKYWKECDTQDHQEVMRHMKFPQEIPTQRSLKDILSTQEGEKLHLTQEKFHLPCLQDKDFQIQD
jgi:hypothetical protein